MLHKALITLLSAALATVAVAQDNGGEGAAAAQPEPPRYPCKDSDKHRAFDFWVGEWNVTQQGQQAGTNEIRLILGDCVLFENWAGAQGSTCKSFNYYDAAEGHWRQIWIDDRGGVIEFTGEVRDGVMYYTATTHRRSDGSEVKHKLTFTPKEDGSVQQLWDQSTDGGETWNTVWNGHYVRQ